MNQLLPPSDAPMGGTSYVAPPSELAAAPSASANEGASLGGASGGGAQSGTAAAGTAAASGRAQPEAPHTLAFESRFESGNLRRAVQVCALEYDLILRPDYHTRGHTQWFFFAVGRVLAGRAYKFNIVNCVKPDSLFNYGMQPLVYSTMQAKTKGVGWRRRGHNVAYYQNHIKRRTGYYYTLSFQLRADSDSDIIYIAYSQPYTLTDLHRYLKTLEDDPHKAKRFRRRTLCETLGGNNVELLTITSFTAEQAAMRARKGVVLSARVHPGESNSSYMMQAANASPPCSDGMRVAPCDPM